MVFTPAIIQYLDIKKEHEDCILFFRMGDFYETFFEDAKTCSKVLDIVLTSKNKNSENSVPMAGIPYHSADKYITKLINNGYKVAIAEQTSEPIPGKIVEREVVSIITPGTYIQETKKEFTYSMGITFLPHTNGQSYHIAWGDFSIGEYWTKSFSDITEMQKFILTIKPVELIFDVNFPEKESISIPVQHYMKCLISVRDLPPDPEKFLSGTTGVQQHMSYGKAVEEGRLETITLLLYYLKHTQKHALTNITKISFHSQDTYLILDEVTIKNLEILSSTYESSEKYSLLNILDTTQTAGGSRLLRYVITNPIKDPQQLQRRLDTIEKYMNDDMMERLVDGNVYKENTGKRIHQILSHVRDIPKLISILLYKKLLPSTCIKLRATLRIFFENKFLLDELTYLGLDESIQGHVHHIYNHLEQLLKNDDEYKDDIDFIRDGYQSNIDELRKIAYHSDDLLMQYQQELANVAGIPNVKVKYILNQGYFLEVVNKDIQHFEEKLSKVDAGLDERFNVVRRNTLKGGQRYSSPYLENLEVSILKAKDDLRTVEFELLHQAQQKIAEGMKSLNEFAERIAWLDLFVSQALLAKEKHFVKPIFINEDTLTIVEGRHPVIEKYLPLDQQFIPNDLLLNGKSDAEEGFLHIITGPNMGGKSTYLRQNALIVLMAHCGLFVPAKECKLGIVDAIFARIGSGDIIAKNQSTFMTEMIEVANILNNASKKSFIIFDELGRGTATYDGLALTKSILEYLVTNIGAKTLIATHYHELIQLEDTLPGVKNFSVSVYETDKEVIFMKKIVKGGASKSYGLDVAKLAGIPATIVAQAKVHLHVLEQEQGKNEGQEGSEKNISPFTFDLEPNPEINLAYEKIKSLLESYDLNNITPLQALQLLSKVKDKMDE
ncbi:MAG: DNA mismatch repair protein MutS [candidate division SR1 bacterium]|nr:DNA mismatch repair protein MutS [candidate division SR1 bacterium]